MFDTYQGGEVVGDRLWEKSLHHLPPTTYHLTPNTFTICVIFKTNCYNWGAS